MSLSAAANDYAKIFKISSNLLFKMLLFRVTLGALKLFLKCGTLAARAEL
jgi:hypothetical protein